MALSKGKRSLKLGLTGQVRKQYHQGAFWTPEELADDLRRLLHLHADPVLTILDNSAGIGRLLHGLERHLCHAIEIDEESAGQLRAGMPHVEVHEGSFLDFTASGFHLALLNPPFNLVIDHPRIRGLGIGQHGKFGAGTRAVSHYVSMALALDAAQTVLAIIPHGALDARRDEAKRFLERYGLRLHAVLDLPEDTFREEGTSVRAQLAMFRVNPRAGRPLGGAFSDRREEVEELFDDIRGGFPRDGVARAIVRPVKREPAFLAVLPEHGSHVRLTRKGRRIVIQPDSREAYHKALDVLAGRPLADSKYALPWRYGDRRRAFGMDINAYLVQGDPEKAFMAAVADVREEGLTVEIDACFLGWLRRAVRRQKRDCTPFRQWAYVSGREALRVWLYDQNGSVRAAARKRLYSVQEGESHILEAVGSGSFRIATQDHRACGLRLTTDEVLDCFAVQSAPEATEPAQWRLLREGLFASAPAVAESLRRRIHALGIDRLIYRFSATDLVELAGRRGGIYGASMGLAKTRMMLSLWLLLGCKHSVVALKKRHIGKFLREYRKLGFPEERMQVVDSLEKARRLKSLNVVAYSTLSAKVPGLKRSTRNTYADLLRGRAGLLCADEGHALSNPESLRSKAIDRVNAGRVYLMTGTAIRGYARHITNLAQLVADDGTPRNPYGRRNPYLTPVLLHSTSTAVRGLEAFAEHFIEVRSASAQFSETLATGFRVGEQPRIKDVARFRNYLAPLMLRRVDGEPEVAAEVPLKKVNRKVVRVKPDAEHLTAYYSVLGAWVDWLEAELKKYGAVKHYSQARGHLAKLHWASVFPQSGRSPACYGQALTTLQERIIADADRLLRGTDERLLLVAENPEHVEFLAAQLRGLGHSVVVAHGGMDIEARDVLIQDLFQDGDARVLAASSEIVGESYDLYAASHVLHVGSYWEPYIAHQIDGRITRPQQTRECHATYYVPEGMLPDYKQALCERKAQAIAEGMDYADEGEEEDMASLTAMFVRMAEDYRSRGLANACAA